MKLITFLSNMSAAEKRDFAERCDTSVVYLGHVAKGRKRAGEKTIANVVRESGGTVGRHDLRPDFYPAPE